MYQLPEHEHEVRVIISSSSTVITVHVESSTVYFVHQNILFTSDRRP